MPACNSCITIVLSALLLSGCATLQDRAITGQTADSLSTVVALHDGFVEQNPLIAGNLSIVLPLKIALAYGTKYLNHPDCVIAKRALGGVGWGAAAWNVLLMSGATSGVGIVAALVSGYYGQDERAAEAACIVAKEGK